MLHRVRRDEMSTEPVRGAHVGDADEPVDPVDDDREDDEEPVAGRTRGRSVRPQGVGFPLLNAGSSSSQSNTRWVCSPMAPAEQCSSAPSAAVKRM